MTIKRFMICLSLAIATMGFTACNSGDDDEPGNIPGQGNGQGGNIGFTPERIVDVSQAGTLPEKISEVDMYKIKSLRLTGVLNGTDILFLRKMAGRDEQGYATGGILENLDISDTKIVSGGEAYYQGYKTNYDEIGDYMFCELPSLKIVLLPNEATETGTHAFYNCANLTSVKIPEKITNIGDYTFNNCYSLTSINLPKALTDIGENAFSGCSSIVSITIPEHIKYIKQGTFKDCTSLASVILPENLKSIASGSHPNPDGYGEVDGYNGAFTNCKSIKEINIPNSVTNIGSFAFMGCSALESIKLPDGIIWLREACFKDCYNLKSITIPQGVRYILAPFIGCKLNSVYIKNSTPPYTRAKIIDCESTILYVPRGSLDKYKNDKYWGTSFADILEYDL